MSKGPRLHRGRVQRVQMVHKVQRVVVLPFGHAFGVRVQRVLRVLRFDSGLWPLRVVVAAMEPLRGSGSEGSNGS